MSIEDLIQNVMDNDFNKANDVFNGLMNGKIADSLEQEKIAVAGQIFGGETGEEDVEAAADFDDEDFDISDEELDEIINDLDFEDEDI